VIDPTTLFANAGISESQFVHGSGVTYAPHTSDPVLTLYSGNDQAGSQSVAGRAQLATDLTNFGNVVVSLQQGNAPTGAGASIPEIPGGSVHLDTSGRSEMKDLLANQNTKTQGH
jgi:hypothetical protein